MSSDHELVQLLGELIDVPAAERQAWLVRRLPDAPAERARLLAAVGDDTDSDDDSVSGRASDGSAPDAPPLRLAVTPTAAIGASMPTSIDRYEILGSLGHGGMGTVYLARDPLMNRQVAVKVLSIAGGLEYRQRFLREARAAGGLRHRNIVTIYDVGESEQGPFIVMERIPGRTLHELLAAGQPPTLSARLAILEDVCAALEAAHHAGVVHRDIKPSNVMVDEDDVGKVLDFGVAKPMTDAAALTRDRLVVGTAGYMSPEQAAAGAVDARSDVYSIAVLAYEFLTSHRPFEPHVSALAPALAAILRRGMATLPADRYQSAAALGRALAGFRVAALAEEANPTLASADVAAPLPPAGTVPVRPRTPAPEGRGSRQAMSGTVMVAAAVAAALVLAAVAWVYLGSRTPPATEQTDRTDAPPVERLGDGAARQVDQTPASSPAPAPPPTPAVVPGVQAPAPADASLQQPAARPNTAPATMSAACRALLAQTSLGEPLTEAQRSTWERNCVS